MTITDRDNAVSDAEEILMRINDVGETPLLSLLDWAAKHHVLDPTIVARLEAGAQAITTLMYETADAVDDLIEVTGLQLPERPERATGWPSGR
ncbi:hypothetical protein MGALJ_03750 [Mycobacterium gallinarum]|jgi:hypothetical protein|uniref:Uncharacterized protein n=2 Tax=Mycobacteriaceae TaxID=1762 RepID=G8RTN9_MYCRN|nr:MULTISPECIES: hypothetical protein [Mycobacteriaceae]AEV76602.1 hypothetical protein MycrhN_6141 [Mycolicibacterium rhodesiae NBB3]BBY90706.1 hypothetical protein MGALJ_03750 [Mycobacterium gallinarum]